jgi:hypothetical protein
MGAMMLGDVMAMVLGVAMAWSWEGALQMITFD